MYYFVIVRIHWTELSSFIILLTDAMLISASIEGSKACIKAFLNKTITACQVSLFVLSNVPSMGTFVATCFFLGLRRIIELIIIHKNAQHKNE